MTSIRIERATNSPIIRVSPPNIVNNVLKFTLAALLANAANIPRTPIRAETIIPAFTIMTSCLPL